jgi:hypothetical protein
MISSQLGNEYMAGATPDNDHASCSDLGVDISCGLPARLRGASAAVAQAPRALPDVCSVQIAEIADQAKIAGPSKATRQVQAGRQQRSATHGGHSERNQVQVSLCDSHSGSPIRYTSRAEITIHGTAVAMRAKQRCEVTGVNFERLACCHLVDRDSPDFGQAPQLLSR